jgi:DNA end-binding protein Ku
VLNTLRFADEILSSADLGLSHKPKLTEKEVAMAVRLIEEMSAKFKPEKYKDTFTEDLERLIGAKAKGKTLKRGPKMPPPTKIVDLMSVLRASVNQQTNAKKGFQKRVA